jgi:hypothetical protein
MNNRYKLATLAITLCCCLQAKGEKGPLTTEELLSIATDVVVGKVNAIYTRTETNESWNYTHYVAEINATGIEKGASLSTKQPVYARYWERRWVGDPNDLPESTSGHWGLPKEGDTARVYLVRTGYDGFSRDHQDGGLNVVFGDGFRVLTKSEVEKTEAESKTLTAVRTPSTTRMKGMKAAMNDIADGVLNLIEYPALPYSPHDQEFIRLLKTEYNITREVPKNKIRSGSDDAELFREEVGGYNDVMKAEIKHRFGRDALEKLRAKAKAN